MIHLPAGIAKCQIKKAIPGDLTAVIAADSSEIAYCLHEANAIEIARALNAQMATRKLNPFDPGAPTTPTAAPEPVEIAKGFNPHGLTPRQVGKGWHLLDEREAIQSGDGFFDPQMGMFLSYECRPDLFRGYNYGALGSQEPREYVHTWAWRRKDEPKKSA